MSYDSKENNTWPKPYIYISDDYWTKLKKIYEFDNCVILPFVLLILLILQYFSTPKVVKSMNLTSTRSLRTKSNFDFSSSFKENDIDTCPIFFFFVKRAKMKECTFLNC